MNSNLTVEALARAAIKALLIACAVMIACLALICWLDYSMGVPLRLGAPGAGMLCLTALLIITLRRARRTVRRGADESPEGSAGIARRQGSLRPSPASVLRRIVIVDGAPALDADAQRMRSDLIN